METVLPEERNKILVELEATRVRLAELEKKAKVGVYKAMWWLTKRRRTEEEKKLFGEKHFDDLPGSSLPEGILVEKDIPVEMSDGVKLAANVFRPDKPGRFPVITAFTPLWQQDFQPRERPRLSRYLQPSPSVILNPPKLENIKVPMLVGSSWIDYYAHLQGTFRGWLRASRRPLSTTTSAARKIWYATTIQPSSRRLPPPSAVSSL